MIAYYLEASSDTIKSTMSDAKQPGLAAMPIETPDNDSTHTKNHWQPNKSSTKPIPATATIAAPATPDLSQPQQS